MRRAMRVFVTTALGVAMLSGVQTQGPPPVRYAQPVAISPAQGKLLKDELDQSRQRSSRMSARLKVLEAENVLSGLGETLSTRAAEEASAVAKTRAAFLKLAETAPQRQGAQAFFNHFQVRYTALSGDVKQLTSSSYKQMRDRTLQLIDENQRAYEVVAAKESLTFNLEVRSTPGGASLAYKRTGDPYESHDRPTETTIENLIYAIWTVQATLGSTRKEQTHDPYRASNHVLSFDLTKP